MKSGLIAGCLVLLGAGALRAGEPSIRAEVDARKVGVEDPLELSLTLEGELSLLQEASLPPLRGLHAIAGPSLSTQVSFVNGSISQRRVYTWTLQPTAVGRAEVGAFTLKLAGGDKTTEPIVIEVVSGSIRPAARRASPLDPFGGEDPFDSVFGRQRSRQPPPKVLIKAVPSRDHLHVGEPLLLTYFVYTQTTITDLRFADAPQYPGFWSEDVERPKSPPAGETVTLEGERFERFPILRKLLFPTRAGKLQIPAATFRIATPRQDLFDMNDTALTRGSAAVEVNVEPIPEQAGFSGAVGRFQASASLDRTTVSLGDAVTLRFRVEGSGNLKWIDKAPALSLAGAKVYPPSLSADLKVGPDGISGSKTWEFTIVPETAGGLDVPALSFSYFDPGDARLAHTDTQALHVSVEGGARTGAPAAAGAPGPPPVARGGLALRAQLDLPQAWLPRPSARALVCVLLAALALHVALWAGPTLVDRRRTASGRRGPRRLSRAALARIDRVGRDGLGKEAAAAALEQALHDVFGPLGDAPAPAAGESEREARALLADIQFLRYAPQLGDYSDKIREVARRAAELVRRRA